MNHVLESAVKWTVFITVTTVVWIGVCALGQYVASPPAPPEDKQIQFCYTEPLSSFDNTIELYGQKADGNRQLLSRHDTLTNAVRAAQQIDCPLLRRATPPTCRWR